MRRKINKPVYRRGITRIGYEYDRNVNESAFTDTVKAGAKAVGDTFKKGAEAVKSGITNLFTGAKKMFGNIINFFKGTPLQAYGSVTAAINQANGTLPAAVTVYPSSADIKAAASMGFSVSKTEVEDKILGPEDSSVKAIEDFWLNVINNAKSMSAEDMTESFHDTTIARYDYLFESSNFSPFEYVQALYEASDSPELYNDNLLISEDSNVPNITYDELIDKLNKRFAAISEYSYNLYSVYQEALDNNVENLKYSDAVKKAGREAFVPRNGFMIWGAPGIGKTQIVRELIDQFNSNKEYVKKGGEKTIIELDAMHIRPDDFQLPVMSKETITDPDSNKKVERVIAVSDLVKSWLPTFVPEDITSKDFEAIKVANTKRNAQGKSIGEGKINGGIIFIDEFSRMHPGTAQVFMNIIQDQKIGNNLLGPGWMIVCAGNRKEDMQSKEFVWDTAWSSRFEQYNYLPSYKQWINWAKKNGLHPDIINWVQSKEGMEFWYQTLNAKEKKTNQLKSEPRSLEIASRALQQEERMRKDKPMFYKAPKNKQMKAGDQLSPEDIRKAVAGIIGDKAAGSLSDWTKTIRNFDNDTAKTIINEGVEKLKSSNPDKYNQIIKDSQNLLTLDPYVSMMLYANTDESGEVKPFNNKQFLNVLKFLDDMSNREDKGGMKVPGLLINAFGTLKELMHNICGMQLTSSSFAGDKNFNPEKYVSDWLMDPDKISDRIFYTVSITDEEQAILEQAILDDPDLNKFKKSKLCKDIKTLVDNALREYPDDHVLIRPGKRLDKDEEKAAQYVKYVIDRILPEDVAEQCEIVLTSKINERLLPRLNPDEKSVDYLLKYEIENNNTDVFEWFNSYQHYGEDMNAGTNAETNDEPNSYIEQNAGYINNGRDEYEE